MWRLSRLAGAGVRLHYRTAMKYPTYLPKLPTVLGTLPVHEVADSMAGVAPGCGFSVASLRPTCLVPFFGPTRPHPQSVCSPLAYASEFSYWLWVLCSVAELGCKTVLKIGHTAELNLFF